MASRNRVYIDNAKNSLHYEPTLTSLIQWKDPIFTVKSSNNSSNPLVINFKPNDGEKLIIQNEYGEDTEIKGTYKIDYNLYIPGDNYLEIYCDGRRYIKTFFVDAPQALKNEGIVAIRDIIEQLSPGLSLDFSDHAYETIIVSDVLKNSEKIKLTYLMRNKDKLLQALNNIRMHPLESLEKEYVPESVIKKQNNKAVLLSLEHHKQFNVKNKNTLSLPENSVLYHILLTIKKTISILYKKHLVKMEDCLKQIDIAESKENSNGGHFVNLILGYKKQIEKYTDINRLLLRLKNEINNTIYGLGLNELPSNDVTLTPKFLKHPSYSYLLETYNIFNAEKVELILNKKGVKGEAVSYKKTPILFELYVYSLIKYMLLQAGYQFDYNFDHEDSPNFMSRFMSDHERFDVYYGESAIAIDDFGNGGVERGLVQTFKPSDSTEAGHITPDLFLVHYKDEQIINISVIEVKCRIEATVFDTNKTVLKQLRDYTLLKFLDNPSTKIRGVDQVLCVYPYFTDNKHPKIGELPYEYISYVALDVKKDFTQDPSFQYMKRCLLNI